MSDDRQALLERRLIEFYNKTDDYLAFLAESAHVNQWEVVKEVAQSISPRNGKPRVLEFGGGRSGFGKWRKNNNCDVHYTVQDITSKNKGFLEECSDAVHIGKCEQIDGEFDIIFCTYVFEHLIYPEKTLNQLFTFLKPGGSFILQCPRYDFPFYLPPSYDHLNLFHKFFVSLSLFKNRVVSLVTGGSSFKLNFDPAVFHLPFSIDRDAIHCASLIDIENHFKTIAKVKSYHLKSFGLKDWFIKRFCTIHVLVEKNL